MEDSTSSSMAGEGRRRGLRLALIASIALNLFFAGIMGVWAVKPLFRGHGGGPGPAGSVADRLAARLPAADQPILRQAFEKRQPDLRHLLDEARKAQQEARRSLRADPFDPDAFRVASDRVRAARDAAQAEIHQAVREAAVAMSPEGRAKLAQPPRGRRGE